MKAIVIHSFFIRSNAIGDMLKYYKCIVQQLHFNTYLEIDDVI